MPIRQILLLLVVVAISLIALIRPRLGLYGYLWYGLMRPDVLAWVDQEDNYYSLLMAVALLLGSLAQLFEFRNLFLEPISPMILLLQIPIGLSVLAAYSTALATPRYSFFIRMIAILLLIPVLVHTEKHVRELLLVIVGSLGFVAAKWGLYGLVHGGVEIERGYGPMLADNNFVALACAMLLPAAWYAASTGVSFPFRVGAYVVAGMTIPAVIMTNSRGGSIALGVGILLVLLRSRQRFIAALLIGACLTGAVFLAQDFYVDRLRTLQAPAEESSAMSRLLHARAALSMWRDYPLFGVGFGGINYSVLLQRYAEDLAGHVVHNSYLQMLVDSGILAFLLYAGALFYGIYRLERSYREHRDAAPHRAAIARALQGPLIVFAVGSNFYSVQRIDLVYIFLLCASAWRVAEKRLAAAPAAAEAPAPAPSARPSKLWPRPGSGRLAPAGITAKFRSAPGISRTMTSAQGIATRLRSLGSARAAMRDSSER